MPGEQLEEPLLPGHESAKPAEHHHLDRKADDSHNEGGCGWLPKRPPRTRIVQAAGMTRRRTIASGMVAVVRAATIVMAADRPIASPNSPNTMGDVALAPIVPV